MTTKTNLRTTTGFTALSARLLLTLAVAAAGAGLLALRNDQADLDAAPRFLVRALGAERPDAPLVRTPARGVSVEIRSSRVGVERGGSRVALETAGTGGREWRRFDR